MSSYASPHIEIAITGRGVVSSIGEGADAFVDALLERRSGIVDGMAPCSEFDPETAMAPKLARRSDRYTQLAFAAAVQAAEEAGLGNGGIDLERLDELDEVERVDIELGPGVVGRRLARARHLDRLELVADLLEHVVL